MKVTLKPLGGYRKYLNEEENHWEFDFPQNEITAKELIQKSKIDWEETYNNSLILINGKLKSMETKLETGDEVVITTLVGGG